LADESKMKKCNQCEVLKPVSEFQKHSCGRYGVKSFCKVCASEMHRIRYRDDKEYRERLKENAKIYYQENTDRVKAYVKGWMAEHPEYVNGYVMRWRAENQEHYRSYMREYLRTYRKRSKDVGESLTNQHQNQI
jgi:hypothetical protein